jgi:predicted aspartyl protease
MTSCMRNLRTRLIWNCEFLHVSSYCAFLGQLTLLLLGSLCNFAFAGDPSVRMAHRPLTEMPFRAYRRYFVVVDGRIGGLEHQNLLLDTGSNPSMIDRELVAKLELESIPRDLSAFNRSARSESVTLPYLQFGPVERQNIQVIVADFSEISHGIGVRINAVVGLDVLGGINFSVDYSKERLIFAALAEPNTAKFASRSQFMIVDLKNGGHLFHLIVDTGAAQLVLFRDHLQGADYQWTNATSTGRNILGTVPMEMIVLTQARIGTQDIGSQKALVAASRKEIGSELDGLMALSCLRPKSISFDFEHGVLGWSD